jgi:hypothetical protein
VCESCGVVYTLVWLFPNRESCDLVL